MFYSLVFWKNKQKQYTVINITLLSSSLFVISENTKVKTKDC